MVAATKEKYWKTGITPADSVFLASKRSRGIAVIAQLTKSGFHSEAASTAPDWVGLDSGRAVEANRSCVMAIGIFALTQSLQGLAAQWEQTRERRGALRSFAIASAEFSPKLIWGTDSYANNVCLPWRVPGT